MTVRFMTTKKAEHVQPNDTFSIFNKNVRVMYITYTNGNCNFYLQPENEPLSSYVQDNSIIVTVPKYIHVDVFVT